MIVCRGVNAYISSFSSLNNQKLPVFAFSWMNCLPKIIFTAKMCTRTDSTQYLPPAELTTFTLNGVTTHHLNLVTTFIHPLTSTWGCCVWMKTVKASVYSTVLEIGIWSALGTWSRGVVHTWSNLCSRSNSDCGCHGNGFRRCHLCIRNQVSWCTFQIRSNYGTDFRRCWFCIRTKGAIKLWNIRYHSIQEESGCSCSFVRTQ